MERLGERVARPSGLGLRPLRARVLAALLLPLACTSVASPSDGARPNPRRPEAATGVASLESGPDLPGSPQAARPRFDGRISPLPAGLRRRMLGTTWKPGCPVPLRDLRLLRFNHWRFDGTVGRGPIVVHEDVAENVLWVFGRLFRARFPIEEVALAREYVPGEFEREYSSRRSVTAAFNCRPVLTPHGPGNEFSRHASGLAVDINPVQNPYVAADEFVRNRMARPFADRSRHRKGMIHSGDVVVRSFAAIGWEWGGHWTDGKDYMHFSLRRG